MITKKHILIALIPTIVCVGSTPLFYATSCHSKTDSVKKIDGSDWIGVFSGGHFDPLEYFPDDENQTVTYLSSEFFQGQNIVIPNYVQDNGITYKVLIDKGCFQNNFRIIGSVELNDFMYDIPDDCFHSVAGLDTIIMHNYPNTIGNNAFVETGLEHFYVKQNDKLLDNWTINLESVGNNAFYQLARLKGNLFFSNKLKEIGEYAFHQCSGLEGIDFRFCTSLKVIPTGAFKNCSLLSKLYLPPALEEIGEDAFSECWLIERPVLPADNMRFKIGQGSFYHCLSFQKFSRPCNIYEIGKDCFVNDEVLAEDFCPWDPADRSTIESTVIPEGAFQGTNYSNLTFYDDFPKNVEGGAFLDCKRLSKLDFSNCKDTKPPQWSGTNIFQGAQERGTILLPAGANVNEWAKLFYDGNKPKQGLIIDSEHWQMRVVTY